MNGLRLAIRNNIPHSWEKVLLKERALTLFIERIYECIPSYQKGKYGYKYGLERAKWMMKHLTVSQCIPYYIVNCDKVNWYEINRKVREYEHNCK